MIIWKFPLSISQSVRCVHCPGFPFIPSFFLCFLKSLISSWHTCCNSKDAGFQLDCLFFNDAFQYPGTWIKNCPSNMIRTNRITSGYLNRTLCPHHAQVAFFACRRMQVWFRQAKQSLLLFHREYGNSCSSLPSDSCSLSHFPLMSSSQNVQLGVGFFLQVLLWSWASSSAKTRLRLLSGSPSTSLSVASKTLVSEASSADTYPGLLSFLHSWLLTSGTE